MATTGDLKGVTLARAAVRTSGRTLAGSRPAIPLSREDRDFAKAFASAINHATAAVAANPDMPVSQGSIADRVHEAYARFQPADRSATGQRARAALSPSDSRHRRYFGAYADRSPD